MLTTIDAAGRVVVPKALRDRLRLGAGSPVEITEHDGVINIAPAPAAVRVAGSDDDAVLDPVEPLPPLTAAIVQAALDSVRR